MPLRKISVYVIIYFALLTLTFDFCRAGNSVSSHTLISSDSIAKVLDLCWVYYERHDYVPMAAYLEEHLVQMSDMDSLEMEMHYALIMAYGHLSRHDKMFESIVKGLLLAQATDHHWMLLSLYRELGSFHDNPLNDQLTGLKYMKKAIPYLDAVLPNSKCGLMMDIGLTSLNAGQLDSAKYYYDQAFEYMALDSTMVPDVYSFYAPYLLKTNQLDEAEYFLLYTYEKWQEVGFKQGFTESCIDLAELYYRKEEYQNSLRYADEAIYYADSIDNIFFLANATEWRAKSLESLGRVEEALSSYSILAIAKDSIEVIKKD